MRSIHPQNARLLIACLSLLGGLSAFPLPATTIEIGRTSDAQLNRKIVTVAREMLGTPYLWAGTTSHGVDCSGLVYNVFSRVTGAQFPRGVQDLQREGSPLEDELQPGDLLFFDTMNGGYASHVGIWIGEGQFIHSASEGPQTGVIISKLEERYYKTRYLGGRRLIPAAALEITITLDQEVAETAFSARIDPAQEVYVVVINRLEDPAYLELQVARKGRDAIKRRFKEDSEETALLFSFIPETSDWTITIADDINRELANIRFAGVSGG